MKILLTHRYYAPDTPPYAMMLHSIAQALSEAGHEVTVFTTRPSYKTAAGISAPGRETMDGVRVRRIGVFSEKSAAALRALNALWYCLRLFVAVLRMRPDTVQAATFPPVVAGWTASLAAKLVGARFVYHMQDVHPEVSVQAGGAMGRGLLRRIATRLDDATLRRADAVVVLSSDMKRTVLERGADHAHKIHVINNFLLETPGEAAPQAEAAPLSDAEMAVIFAGNIGLFQGLDALIDAARRTQGDLPGLHYWILGDGAARKGLIEQAGDMVDHTVFFAPFRPAAEAAALIRRADLAVASLSPGIYRVSYPSKILTYLGLGAPVFVCVEYESELARMVSAEGVGYSAPPGAVDAIVAALRQAWEDRADLPETGARAAALHDARFSLARAGEAWCGLYRLMEQGGATPSSNKP